MNTDKNRRVNPLPTVHAIAKLASILPRGFRSGLERNFVYAMISDKEPDEAVGKGIVGIALLSVFIGFITFNVTQTLLYLIIAMPLSFVIGLLTVKSVMSLLADKTANFIDHVLPDMLLLMSANLRAGIIPEQSFISSIRPQFGKLNNLLNAAAVEVHSGKSFEEAVVEMATYTSSRFFRDAMRIIAEAARSGGELATILENLANNLLQNEVIRDNMKAQVRSYSLFIFLASVIAAPLLYGVASFLIGILDSIGKATSSGVSGGIPSSSFGFVSGFYIPQISESLILFIATINVIITTTSSALIGGILNEGNVKYGIRYVPIYVLIGLAIFFGVRLGISGFFASSSFGGGLSSGPVV